MTSFWWLILFFIDLLFIFRICKKYTNTDGKDRKHANTIDISPIDILVLEDVGSHVEEDVEDVGSHVEEDIEDVEGVGS